MHKCFFDVFVAVAVVLAAALYFDLKGHSVMTNGKIQNVQSCVYRETTGYYEKCSCFVKRCFLQTQCKCNETFIIEWIKTWKIMNILLFENSVRPILLFSAWIIIASWTYCWKYFVLFFFCHLNWVKNLHLGGYTAYIIHP